MTSCYFSSASDQIILAAYEKSFLIAVEQANAASRSNAFCSVSCPSAEDCGFDAIATRYGICCAPPGCRCPSSGGSTGVFRSLFS